MTSLRGLIAVALVFLVANVISLPEHAGADVQYFPIPAVSTSKNDGNDTGLIVPFLITDPEGELKYLVAPMIVRNSIVGTRAAMAWTAAVCVGVRPVVPVRKTVPADAAASAKPAVA